MNIEELLTADKEFEARYAPNRYSDRVQRLAVLYPLMKNAHDGFEVIRKTQQLVGVWRMRVTQLKEAGWAHIKKHGRLTETYTRNCCPTFAYMVPRTKTCSQRAICPFCYARWVQKVWAQIDSAFPNPRQQKGDDKPNLVHPIEQDVVVDEEITPEDVDFRPIDLGPGSGIHQKFEFPYHLVTARQVGRLAMDHDLGEYLACIAARRKEVQSYVNPAPIGAFAHTTVVPHTKCNPPVWHTVTQWLMMVDKNAVLHDRFIEKAKPERIDRPSRKQIFNAVSAVCRYPIGLFRCEADLAVQILNARAGKRLSAMYGSFRNSHIKVC